MQSRALPSSCLSTNKEKLPTETPNLDWNAEFRNAEYLQNGVQQTRSGLGREGGHGEGRRGHRRVRQLPPDKSGTRRSAARGPWAAPGGSEHLEKPGCMAGPNFAGAAERGADVARDGEGRAGCARFRLASLPHAARPHALPVGSDRVE